MAVLGLLGDARADDSSDATHAEEVMTDWKKEMGPRLRAMRLGCGMTQQEVANGAGVRRGNISHIELGQQGSPKQWEKMAKAMGYEMSIEFRQ